FRELRRPYNVRILRPLFTDAIIYSMGVRGTGVQQFQNTWTSSTERVALKIYEKTVEAAVSER
ncbi:MAG: hypothetical protein IJX66_05180, partial [Lachnospiraceae bacterium]|nr:hypothetical protein [Lachnospiraceae bacterium]